MSISRPILDAAMYFFEATLFYTYANDLFPSPKATWKKLIPTAFAFFTLFIIYQTDLTVLNMFFMPVLYFAVFYFIFGAKFLASLLHTVLFSSVMISTEVLVMNTGQLFFNGFYALHTDDKAYIYVITLSKLLFAVIMLIIKRLYFLQFNSNDRDAFYWVLFLLPCTVCIINVLFAVLIVKYPLSDTVSLFFSAVLLLLLFTSLVIFIVYDKVCKDRTELYELRALQLQQDLDRRYFEAVEQARREQMHFTHDIKNHLLHLRYMDEITPMHAYLDSLINDVDKLSYVDISSNKTLNLIISKYAAICEKKNITFEVSVHFADLHHIGDTDLSAVLNNLLDNAVEAAEKTENPTVSLSVFAKNHLFDGIIIRNTCLPPPQQTFGAFLRTTKTDRAMHGMGLRIVAKVLEKYSGVYDWKYDRDTGFFETDIALPRKATKECPDKRQK